MRKYLILLFAFATSTTFSQKTVINDSSILKKGIYQNFEEFKYNSPSIECNLKVEKGRMNYAYGIANYNYHQSYIISFDSATKNRIKNVYGYCDGKNIYIRKEKTLEDYIHMVSDRHFEKDAYNKVLLTGVYSCFEDIISLGAIASVPNQQNYVQTSVRYDSDGKIVLLGIDMNTGEVFPLTKENLKIILMSDSELYQQYTSKPKTPVLDIVAQFNKKHKVDGIYKNEVSMRLEEAYTFVKRQDNDSLLNIYFNRVLNGLRRNNAFLNTSIFQEKYKNGTLKTIGIQTDHHYRQNDGQTLFKVGHWYYCYEDGSLKEEIEYDIFEKKIKSTKYNRNGDVVK